MFLRIKGVYVLSISFLSFLACTAPNDVPTTGSISGIATSAISGTPLSDVSISTDPVTQTVTTNSSGEFLISSCPIQTYAVTATKQGFNATIKNVTVTGGGNGSANFVLIPTTGSITGTITVSKAGTVLANATITTTPSTQTVTSDAAGTYTIANCPAGTYTVSAAKDGYISVTKEVVVTGGAVTSGSIVLSQSSGIIKGKITDRDGNAPLIGAALTTSPVTSSVSSDGTGNFTINDVVPNSYTITAVKAGYRDATSTVTVGAGQTATANIQMDAVTAVLSASPNSLLDFSTNSSTLQLTITNTAGAGSQLSYTISKPTDATWLTTSKSGGQITTTPDQVVCTVTRQGLNAGNYSTSLTINSNGGDVTLSVTMVVPNVSAPQLSVSKFQLDFDSLTSTLQFSIINSGTGTLNYTISDNMEWLTVSPSSGSTNATPAPITATISRSGIGIGTYAGQITITSDGGNGTVGVGMKVTSAVLPAPTLQALNITKAGCQLAWTAATDITQFASYKVFKSTSPNVTETSTLVKTITTSTSNNCNVTGTAGATEYFKVYVYNKAGAGSASNEVTVRYPDALKTWTLAMNTSQYGYTLTDIHSIDDNHAWAVGNKSDTGIILKFNYSSRLWEREVLPSGVINVGGIHMLSASQGYANARCNIEGQAFLAILKYDGISWSIYRSLSYTGYYRVAYDIYAVSDSVIFASYCTYINHIEFVYKITQNDWADQGVPGLWFTFRDSNDGYVFCNYDYARKYNGFGWTSMETSSKFEDMSISKETGILYALKDADYNYNDTLFIFNNSDQSTKKVTLNVSNSNHIFVYDDTHIWVSTDSEFAFYDGTSIQKVSVAGAERMWFHSATSGWAIANNGIYMYR